MNKNRSFSLIRCIFIKRWHLEVSDVFRLFLNLRISSIQLAVYALILGPTYSGNYSSSVCVIIVLFKLRINLSVVGDGYFYKDIKKDIMI